MRKPPEIDEDFRSETGIRHEPVIRPETIVEPEIPMSNSLHPELSREQTVAQNVDDALIIDVPPVRRSTREIRRPKRFD